MSNPKPVLRWRRIRRGAAVIPIYRSGMIPSKIICVVNGSYRSIKVAFFLLAFQTVNELSTIKIHSCVGGAIRTVNTTDVNILKQFATSTSVTEYVMTCQNSACMLLSDVWSGLRETAWVIRKSGNSSSPVHCYCHSRGNPCQTPYPYMWPHWQRITTVSMPIQSQVLTASHSKQKTVYWLNQKHRIFLIARPRC